LAKYGFDKELAFIPYSTRAAWCAKYPNAIPYVECIEVVNSAADGGGVSTVVRGYPLWSPHVNSVTDIPREVVEGTMYHGSIVGVGGAVGEDLELAAAMAAAAAAETETEGADGTNNNKRPREDKLFPKGILSNSQRSELHAEIYNYFMWLRTQVKAEGGKGKKSVGGMSSDGLKDLLRSMGDALPSAKISISGGSGSGEDQPTPFLEEALFAKLKYRIDTGTGATSSSSAKRQKKASGISGERKVRKEKGPLVTWEERLKQLTEFGEQNGHFDVPVPLEDDDEDDVRFYNWVQKINYELRAYNNGNTTKLTKERADQLAAINFEPNEAKPRGRPRMQQIIPDVPWKKRIQQLISYKDDVGHLKIDHQYKHCDNLGGWAVNMSTKYQKWSDGELTGDAKMEAQFDELKGLGFNFDIKPSYESTRSWDDHYEKLKEFKEQNGNARVPLKWKADLRLGKWVQLQRKARRTNKISEDHLMKLESIGFEWEVPKDEQYQPPQQQQQQQGPVTRV